MHRLLFLLFLVLLPAFSCPAQDSTWYQVGPTYYKIKTAKDGMYRISSQVLHAAGMSSKKTDPRQLRLYHRGKEVAIYLAGQEDGRLDDGDYLDFVGSKNDGTVDQLLYGQQEAPNPYVSIFSDTTAYFLVHLPGERGKRMTLREAPASTVSRANFAWQERVLTFSEQYAMGRRLNWGLRSSAFEQGEGWVGPVLGSGLYMEFAFDSLGTFYEGQEALLELGWMGRSEGAHGVELELSPGTENLRRIDFSGFLGFSSPRQTLPIYRTDLSASGMLVVRLKAQAHDRGRYFSLAYAKLLYPRAVAEASGGHLPLLFPSNVQQAVFFSDGESHVAYESADPQAAQKLLVLPEGDSLRAKVGISERESKVWWVAERDLFQVEELQPLRFRAYGESPANFLIVSPRQLEWPSLAHANPLLAYASYRASAAGGGYDTLLLRMEELYDQFSFGERTPLALHAFLKAHPPQKQPSYLLLAGRGLSPFAQLWKKEGTGFYRNDPGVFPFQEFVPTGGFPPSDKAFVWDEGAEGRTSPFLAVGRIPAATSQQLSDYLLKLIEKDSLGRASGWPRRILHLAGGMTPLERQRHESYLEGFASLARQSLSAQELVTYRKNSASEVERLDLSEEVNAGIALLTFFGHGSSTQNELDYGNVSDLGFGYSNAGNYPFLLVLGCDYANAFGPQLSQAEDWILHPKKGALAVLGTSALGVDLVLKRYAELFYSLLFAGAASPSSLTLGELILEADRLFLSRYGKDPAYRAQLLQLLLLGDPAQRLYLPSVREGVHK